MSKLTRAWVDSQIEQEFERGCHAEAVRDLAALIIVRDFMTEGDEAVSVAAKSGIAPAEYADFYAAINAVASDYGMVAKRHGVDRLDYWVDMAKAFMHDDDAVDGKIYEYRQYIAK